MENINNIKKRGRPQKYTTDEERKQAKYISNHKEENKQNFELAKIEASKPKVEEVSKPKAQPRTGVEVDEDGDGVMDGIDFDGDGVIDMHFAHRQCEHVWGDSDHDGHEECQKCGLLKEQYNG